MQDSQQITPRILVTTDFSLDSERAFYHALAFALARQARLTLLHTGSESRSSVPWDRFPGVRETLQAWGMLPPEAPRSAVADTFNVSVAKMAMRDDDPRQGITDYLRKHPTDLLVMVTKGRTGLARIFDASVAETVSYLTRSHTLMLPHRGRGLVDPNTGKRELRRVLCVLDPARDPRPALAYLKQWLPAIGDAEIDVHVLQVCQPEDAMEILLPPMPGLAWTQEARPGERVSAIVSTAREMGAQLVVMTTRGPLGLLARMRGSDASRVLQELRLPLLSIPRL